MRNAPVQKTNEGAADTSHSIIGHLPTRTNTVTADVLATLLASNAMTGMESVFKQSTTRLGAVVFYLENHYGWQIERREIATGTNDGRVATVAKYWLPQATIAAAFEAGAREWIERVKVGRAQRRQQSGKCKSAAARINAGRLLKLKDPRQEGLWGEL